MEKCEKEDNLLRYTKFFEKHLPGYPVSFDFNSGFGNFRFFGTFPIKFPHHLSRFQNVLVECNAANVYIHILSLSQ